MLDVDWFWEEQHKYYIHLSRYLANEPFNQSNKHDQQFFESIRHESITWDKLTDLLVSCNGLNWFQMIRSHQFNCIVVDIINLA